MPHLRFRACEEAQVQSLSASLPGPLAAAIGTNEENFTFEFIPARYFFAGKPTPSYPFVEVLWFAREGRVQKAVADILDRQVKDATGAADVAVVFTSIPERDYFENGKHF